MRQKQIKCQQKLSNKNIIRRVFLHIWQKKNFAQLAFEYSRVGQNTKRQKRNSNRNNNSVLEFMQMLHAFVDICFCSFYGGASRCL